MWSRSVESLGMIPDMNLCAESIDIAKLWLLAALLSYIVCVIMFFAIHQNKGPAEWGNAYWQKLISKRYKNYRSRKLQN